MANNQTYHYSRSSQVQEHQKPTANMFNREKMEAKTITNIYYDCLERIFDFLDLESLLNVAQTCKLLQIAAAAKFSDMHGKKCIVIFGENIYNREKNFEISNTGVPFVRVRVNGLKSCLPFLRCFGSKILHLHVVLNHPSNYVDQYVNQYCTDTVKRIQFNQMRFIFTMPFKNVEKLHLYNASLGNELSNLVKWFPKLRHLKLGTVYNNTSSFGVFFPQLEQVTLYIDALQPAPFTYYAITDPNARDTLTIENAKDLLRANQQLTYIDIRFKDSEFTMTTLLNIISSNPSILTLHASRLMLPYMSMTDVNMDELNRLISGHRSIVELDLTGYEITCAAAIYIIRHLNSLKKFSIYLKNRFEYNCLLNQMGDEWKNKYISFFHRLYDDITYTGRMCISLTR